MDDHKLQIILAARDATKSAFLSASGQVKAFTKNIFSLRGAMAGLAGAAGMGMFVKKSLESADAIGKAADVIGISTDALQEYRHAARLAGISTELMDNSFKAFSKRVGEARNETGALVTFLKKFDEQLLKDIQTAKSTEEALDLVMKRMGRTASQTDRAALAAAAFSRSGLVLSNMVKDGADGLARMRQEARDLGIVMDEKLIRESERANDELEKLTRVLKVQFMSAAASLAPEIARMAESTTKWLRSNNDLIVSIKTIGSTLASTVKIRGRFIVRAKEIYGFKWDDIANAPVGARVKIFPMPKDTTKMPAKIITTGPKSTGGINEDKRLLKDLKAAQDEFTKSLIISSGTYETMEQQLRRGIGDTVQEFQEGYKFMENLSQRTAEAMEQNFSDFYFDAMRGEFNSLRDYANAVLRSIQRATADVLGQMTKEFIFGKGSGGSGLLQSAGKWLGSLFGGGGSGYNPADWAETLWAKGGVFEKGRVHAFAHGSVINHPTLFPMAHGAGLMGEAGPEAIMPLTRTSSGDLGVRAEGSSRGVTNINIYAWDSQSMEQFVRRHKDIFVGINVENIERNGDLRQAIGATI